MNEQGRVGAVVRAANNTLPDATIVVVDDASTDASLEEARDAGAIVLPHGCNLGYGAALETGYLYAVEHNYQTILQMDADGQHQADQLHLLLGPLRDGSADLVIGSRYGGDKPSAAASPLRTFGHRVFGAVVFVLTRRRLSDPTSGFQALNRRALDLFANGSFPCDYPDSDVILMAHMAGLRIHEIPVVMKGRDDGHSMHGGLKPLYYGIKMLLSIFIVLLNVRLWHRWRKANRTTS